MRVLFICVVIIWVALNVGFSQGSTPDQKVGEIYTNQIKASFIGRNGLFSGVEGAFVYPGHGVDLSGHENFIQRNGVWLGGYNSDGKWRTSASSKLWSRADYFPGPSSIDIENQDDWARAWNVSGWEIWNLRNDYLDNGKVDDMPSVQILAWPGRGNLAFESITGFELPDQELAPFFDVDSDGNYNPFAGDFPCFDPNDSESIPGQMAWLICNDIQGVSTESMDPGIDVEIATVIFGFDVQKESILNSTIFVRQTITNRSSEQLSDIHLGHYFGPKLGCYHDDLGGCDVEENVMYGYSKTQPDTVCKLGNVFGVGYPEPVFTISFLSHSLNSFLVDHEPSPVDDFQDAFAYEKLLQGFWYDGEPITYGGTGYQSGGQETAFMFPGRPSDPSAWSAFGQPFSSGIDFMLGVSKLGDLEPGQGVRVDHAYTLHDLPFLGPAEAVDTALGHCQEVQEFYDSSFSINGGNPLPCLTDCIWPGDMDANGMCNNLDLLEWGISLDRMGVKRTQPFIGWLPQHGLSWGKTGKLDSDARHQDANGDGTVDPLDLFALNENFGKTVNETIDWGGATLTGPEIKLTRIFNPLTSPDELLAPGKKFMIQFDVNDWPVDSIYNLGYSITFDPVVVSLDPGFNYIPKSSFFVDSSEVFVRSSEGRVNVGITRTDHVNLDFTPFELGKLRFTIKQDAPQEQYPDTTEIVIQNVKAYLADGTLLDIGSNTVRVPFGLATGLDLENDRLSEFVISPNPTNGLVSWSSKDPVEIIDLYSLQGQHLNRWIVDAGASKGEIELPGLPGVYLIAARGYNGKVQRMKVVRL